MNSELPDKKFGLKRLCFSFKYALEGIVHVIKREPNMMIHVFMSGVVIFGGIFFQISLSEWIICLLLIGLVMSAELINTAIESVVDLVCQEKKFLAKVAKDTAAGAVFFLAFVSCIIGIIIFLPKIITLFS